MKLHPITKALLFLMFSYLIVFVMSYSSFFQIPVVPDQNLMWKSLIEQSTNWLWPILAYAFLFQMVFTLPSKKKPFFEEKNFLLPSFFLLFLAGISIGVHSASQIFEDVMKGREGEFLYNIIYIADEYPGHSFLIFLTLFLWMLSLVELNRRIVKTTKLDVFFSYLIGAINGLLWGVAGIEGGSMYLVTTPIVIGIGYHLFQTAKKHRLTIRNYLFTNYLFVSIVFMLLFTVIWVFRNGILYQPSQSGWMLFNI